MGADEINKPSVTATAVPASEEERPNTNEAADLETQTVKPNKDFAAAIWAIVCGVALPCIPVIIVSAVLLYFIFRHEIVPRPGWPELHVEAAHVQQAKTLAQHVQSVRHQGGHWAYYVHYNSSTITTIASWTGRVIPYLSSSIMALVAFFAARKVVTKSRRSTDGQGLPSPEQLTLLIGLLGGKSFGPLKDTVLHRFRSKQPLIDPIPLAACALFLVTSMALLIPIVDTWFGIATTSITITQLYNHTGPNHGFGRQLASFCDGKAGNFGAMSGSEWISCNVMSNSADGNSYSPVLSDPDEANRLVQGISTLNTIANYTANGTQYFYLADPAMSDLLDFQASTVAVSATCAPISRKCLPGQGTKKFIDGQTGPAPLYETYYNFTCSPGFKANMTFSGAAQTIDALASDNGSDASFGAPMVGMAFSPDANLSRRVGHYNGDLETWIDDTLATASETGSIPAAAIGSNWSYAYLQPQNPLYFGAWATGFPGIVASLIQDGDNTQPLLNDDEIFVMGTAASGGLAGWILGCSAEVFDVSYTWSNGSIHTFTPTLASADMGGMISAPFGLGLSPQSNVALTTIANVASAQNTSQDLANVFAEGWSKAALAMSIGGLEPKLNDIEQFRNSTIKVARVPMVPLYLLLGLKAIYVVAVILLAIGAYCFTHPAETEVVKAQLSAKGLAAAHFDTPGLVQQNVVKEIGNRLQATKEKDAETPASGELKRAATAPAAASAESEKKVGLVATATGAWTFAVVADGVWNSIKPIAVSMVDMEAKNGKLGEAGDLINAWKG